MRTKIRSVPIAMLLSLVTLTIGTALRGQDPSLATFTSLDFPDAVFTQAFGINPGGEIVGLYVDARGIQHGFLFSRGDFRSIDYPGAAVTDARGINPAGDIVGSYRRPGETPLNFHGFLLTRRGEFIPIDFPGHINTIPQRILPDGTVLGCYHDTDTMGTMHGFVLSAGQYSGFDMATTMHNGATPDLGHIAGLFFDMTAGRSRAYEIENGGFNPFDFPGSIATQGWDVNPSGALVGIYTDGARVVHGFVKEDGQFTSIDFPGATRTVAFGINPGGDIVGRYVDSSGKSHGFVLFHSHTGGRLN